MRELDVLNDEMRAAGVRVFGGLAARSTATMVCHQDGGILLTNAAGR